MDQHFSLSASLLLQVNHWGAGGCKMWLLDYMLLHLQAGQSFSLLTLEMKVRQDNLQEEIRLAYSY